MKPTLTDEDRVRLDGLIAGVEKRTNAQVVLALIRRSDSYAELPWKAFALGSSLAALLIFFFDLQYYDWYPGMSTLATVAGILGNGVFLALLTVLLPTFARWFLSDHRAEVEVLQYAESLFLSRELFATTSRTGILILVSLFERKVVVLPDKGLSTLLPDEARHGIIAEMTPLLKRRSVGGAFEAGLEKLSAVLGAGVAGSGRNELSDQLIEEKGV